MAPYDRWGFPQKLNSQDEDEFLSMANRLDRRSEELKVELKMLVRSGITDQYRAHIWRQCIQFHVRETKKMAGPKYYQKLLESIEGKFSPAAKQIGLDLLRTLPNNVHYEKPDSPGIEKLRRVLLAYSWHNPDVGYCQGINRLVAIAMLYLTEEEAFWCMVAFIEHIMPKDYYSKTLLAAQADQRVLKDFLADKLPKIYAHLENLSVDLSLLTFNWFLTVFVDSFPIEVLFRFALAVFKINEEQILKIEDSMGIFNFMRQVPEKIADHHLLTQTAFQGLNPFPMQKIRIKRRLYTAIVQAELDELDQLRDSYIHERKDNDVLSDSEIPGDDQ